MQKPSNSKTEEKLSVTPSNLDNRFNDDITDKSQSPEIWVPKKVVVDNLISPLQGDPDAPGKTRNKDQQVNKPKRPQKLNLITGKMEDVEAL